MSKNKKEQLKIGDTVYLKNERPPRKRRLEKIVIKDRKKYGMCSYLEAKYSKIKLETYLIANLSHYPDDWKPLLYLGDVE